MLGEKYQILSNKILTVLNSDIGLKEMIENVIRHIQSETNYSAVGIRLKNGEDFPYFVQCGFPQNFLLIENSLISRKENWKECKEKNNKPDLECTCGLVISGMAKHNDPFFTEFGSFWTNNSYPLLDLTTEEDPRSNPRNTCINMGYSSFAIIPIRAHGTIIGTIQLNHKSLNAFTEESIHFFEDTSLEIGIALMRKQTEESLAQNEKYLKEIQGIAQIGSYDFNIIENIWASSDILNSIFGIQNDYPKSFESWLRIIHPDYRQPMLDYFLNEVIGEGKRFDKEYKIIRVNDKEERWVVGYGNLKFDQHNRPVKMIGTIMDITERKLAEIHRDAFIEQLRNRNRDLEQFSYIVSHNLRSPLANLMGLTELMTENTSSETDNLDIAKSITTCVQKLDEMVKDLNYILQVRDQANNEYEIVDLNKLVTSIKSSIELDIKNEKVQIITDFSGCDRVLSSKSYLYSIFYNLIANSIKYRKPFVDPVIAISCLQTENKIELEFIDNGLGIDLKKNGEKIFGLYKRFHFHTDGKGMGLYMVKTQVESLGGILSVTSEVNVGTTFKIELPLNNPELSTSLHQST